MYYLLRRSLSTFPHSFRPLSFRGFLGDRQSQLLNSAPTTNISKFSTISIGGGGFSLGSPAAASQQVTVNSRAVGWWMLATSGLVFGIVSLGGVTRLTESGLSMVDWSLMGSRPPMGQEEWEAYFQKYKQFPEFKVLNKHMTVDEFKSIFWFEYLHRMMGRFIGAFFVIPGLWFIARGHVTPLVRNRILGISTMIFGQGALGWYMVKSGLDHQLIEDRKVPRVSQYRLAAHLSSAFVIYLSTFITGLGILSGRVPVARVAHAAAVSPLARLTQYSHAVGGMVFLTAVSGAFVAGLDAGLIYNTFPKMADRWIPSDILALQPLWTNVFENPTTVQFNHRILAMSTYFAVGALWMWSRRLPLPPHARLASNVVFGIANIQVLLGISTLLWLVPVPLAAAHQSGSLALLTSATYLNYVLRRIPK